MKRPGRPALDPDDRSVPVSINLPSKQYDALCRYALREGVSLPEFLRRYLPRYLPRPNKPLKTRLD